MIRATLKSLLSRKVRLVLSGLAVVLGATFVSGAFVLTDTLGRTFDQLFDGIYANTDVEVRAVPNLSAGGLDEDSERITATVPAAEVDRIRDVAGVATADGIAIADGARLVGANGKVVPSVGPPRFGVDWPSHSRGVELREGRGPNADDEIAINASLATAGGVKVGDRVGVLTLEPKQTFTLVGIFGYPGGADSQGGTQMIAFTEPVAQRLMLGTEGAYSFVDIKADPGISDEALRDRLAADLGPQYQVKTGAELAEANAANFKEFLSFFNYILIGFAFVALFVAVFLILNTFSIIVAQRTRELALVRALGANRRQVIGSVLLEALVIGVIASVVGLAAGVGVGALLANLFGGFAGGVQLASIGVPAASVIGAFGVGLGVTVLAALIPALRAARVAPVAAMRDAATADRPLTKLTIVGGIVLAAGIAATTLGLTGTAGDQTLWAILGGVLLSFIGTALLTPLVARPVAGLIGRLFSWSVPGKLGRLNAGRNPRRTAITAAALMVGIALITGINTILTSAKESIAQIANEQAHVDLIVSGESGPGGIPPTFDPTVIDEVSAMAGVRSAVAHYEDMVELNGEPGYVSAFSDLSVVPEMFSLKTTAGVINAIDDDGLIIDSETAAARGLQVGSPVTVQMARGEPVALTVSGIYASSDLVSGFVVPISLKQHFFATLPTTGFVQVEPGTSVGAIKSQVDGLLADSPEITVGDRADFLAQQNAEADQILVMVQILLALAILIAVLGVVNTLALSVLERTRELGLLRAVGLGRAQTMRMVTVEAVVISVFGAVLGLAVGTGLGAAVVRALRDEGITVLALPWDQMATYLGLAAVVGVVAAVLPAIRAARVNVLQAIAYE